MYGMSITMQPPGAGFSPTPYGYQGYGGADAYGADEARSPMNPLANEEAATYDGARMPGEDEKDVEDKGKLPGRKSSPADCETCKNRKYKDGSDEMVSFKAAGHINPNAAASVVMSHEREHVSNAYQKAKAGNGEVKQASVQLKMDVCPECGRTYVSGGLTTTQIVYYNEENPYQQDMKSSDAVNKYRGANVDVAA